MHTTLEFYLSRYNGNKFTGSDSVAFEHYCLLASSQLDLITYNRIKVDDDNVQLCTCELIDCMFQQVAENENNVQSESLGNRSVTYKSQTNASKSVQIQNICKRWLGNTGLMYAGFTNR